MKSLALHVAALTVLLAGAASAADIRMPVKAPAPVPVAVYNWTGCYVGAGFGYGMFDQESRPFVGGAPFASHNDNGGRGWFGTVLVGCDYQVGSNIVIGAFGDYDFSGIKGDMSLPTALAVGEEKLKNSWAAGGRIGWIPWQQTRFLVFVSGGYTQSQFDAVSFRNAINNAPTAVGLAKNTYDGWFVGGGYEYGLSLLPGLFWRAEYRLASLGKEQVNILVAGVPNGQTVESSKYVQTVRSELVWRFNAGGPATAYAADLRTPLPVKAPTPVAAAYNWTGCYVGAGGGYGIFDQRVQYTPNGVPTGPSNDVGGRGWFGTVQVGCDYQVAPSIAVGAFADYNWSGIKGIWTNPNGQPGLGGEEKLKNSWAAGGRLGWAPFNQFMVFVSGGYSEAQFGDINLAFLINGVVPGASIGKHTYSGWFVGSGYEYGVTWLPGLFWKTEYRFYDYGTERVQEVFAGAAVPGELWDQRKYVQTVRSELVWRFNFGGPVVARY